MALAALGRHAEALASFDRVLAAEPEHVASWLGRGEALRFLERHDEALAAFERANALAPTLAVAWTQRGSILRDRGRIDAARHAFEQAIAHGGDPELNGYFLAALTGANAPAQAPVGYVLRFFDEYATTFDAHLVATLGYRAPAALVEQIVALGPRRFASALDLGCAPACAALGPSAIASGVDLRADARDRPLRRADRGDWSPPCRRGAPTSSPPTSHLHRRSARCSSAARVLDRGLSPSPRLRGRGERRRLLPSPLLPRGPARSRQSTAWIA
jgi:hypothetical protein